MNPDSVRFEWDVHKAKANLKKHKVSFDEARLVFDNPFAKIFHDDRHSSSEFREILVGYSRPDRLLLVSFTERPAGLVRIISARVATQNERVTYEENNDL